jgi:hypothetical protein
MRFYPVELKIFKMSRPKSVLVVVMNFRSVQKVEQLSQHLTINISKNYNNETFRSVFRPIRNRIWPSELREMFFYPIQPLVGFNMVHWQGVDKKNVILFKTNRKSNLARLGMESF